MKEVWKDIKDYEGLYQVSNMGNVKSLKFGKERILKECKNNDGYIQVGLFKNGKRKIYKVHRLVAETFILNIDNKQFIDHINTDRTDNRVENLRWCTHIENMNNPLTKEKMTINSYYLGKIGKDNKMSKKVIQYDNKGNFIKEWNCIRDIERELNLNHSNISKCCNNNPKNKSVGGYIWRYKLCG